MKKVLIAFATLALAVASAASKTYHVTLSEPATVNGTQLKPGDYKVQVEGDKAILTIGKTVIEAPAKVETSDRKYDSTQVSIEKVNNRSTINEIRVGGTNTRIIFAGGTSAGQ
jgi:thiamine pyrophosphokinase